MSGDKSVSLLLHNAYLKDVLQRFPSLFAEELGTCHNFKVKFNLASDARPVQIPCRQIAFAMENLLEEELRRQSLKSKDIIKPVDTCQSGHRLSLSQRNKIEKYVCAQITRQTLIVHSLTTGIHCLALRTLF